MRLSYIYTEIAVFNFLKVNVDDNFNIQFPFVFLNFPVYLRDGDEHLYNDKFNTMKGSRTLRFRSANSRKLFSIYFYLALSLMLTDEEVPVHVVLSVL